MLTHPLGQSGLAVSELGFGCGAVGGLMIKGDPGEQARAIALAIDHGFTYFDTAAAYGDGVSETNLGRALRSIRGDVVIGTKIRLTDADRHDIEDRVVQRVDAGLRRLGRDRVDLMQLHNLIGPPSPSEPDSLSVSEVSRVVDTFNRLKTQGKLRAWGVNGLGEMDAVHACLDLPMDSMQICYNMLNPTAGFPAPAGFPFVDQRQIIDLCAARNIGVIAFRILAGGALTGTLDRHANASDAPDTIMSTGRYDEDARLAGRLMPLLDAGFADSLVEAAIRFSLTDGGVSTSIVGFSTTAQLQQAITHAARGPLPGEALTLLADLWAGFGPT